MQLAVMQIVEIAVVIDRHVTAIRTMLMVMSQGVLYGSQSLKNFGLI